MTKTIIGMFAKLIYGIIVLTIGGTTVLMNIMIAISQGTDDPILESSVGTIIFVLTCGMISGAVLVIYGLQKVGEGVMYTNTKEYEEKLIKTALENIKVNRQEGCQHETYHQVGFTNLLACDNCGMTFTNPHFVEASK